MPTPVVRGSLVAGDKEIELVMPVPAIGAEPLLSAPLEVVALGLPTGPGLAVGPADRDEGWAFAPLASNPEAALAAARARAVTIVLREAGGTDMAGRPHEVVMGFRSVDLSDEVASALVALTDRAAQADPSAPTPTMAEIRAASRSRTPTE